MLNTTNFRSDFASIGAGIPAVVSSMSMDLDANTGSDTCLRTGKNALRELRSLLFRAAADAGKVLRLSPVEQAVLSALVVCITVKSVGGAVISVTASSQQLEDLTGFAASSVSGALRSLSHRQLIRRVASRSNRRFQVACEEIGQWSFYGFDLAPLREVSEELRAGAKRVDAERRWLRELRHQINSLSSKAKSALETLDRTNKRGSPADVVREYEILAKRVASRSTTLEETKALREAWQALVDRLAVQQTAVAEVEEHASAVPLPCPASLGDEPTSDDQDIGDSAVPREGGVLSLVNANLPVIEETIGKPVSEFRDVLDAAPVLAVMTGVGMETWIALQHQHGPLLGALVLGYFAQILDADVASGRWKIKHPKAYLRSLSDRIQRGHDIVDWIEGLGRPNGH